MIGHFGFDLRIAVLVDRSLPADFEDLRTASILEGYAFLDRLAREVRDDNAGWDEESSLLGAFVEGELAAIGAQTVDTYDPHAGRRRMRHFYVAPRWRRRGVGSALARELMDRAFRLADCLHLRAADDRSAAFWETLGFQSVEHDTRTHCLFKTPSRL